MFKLKKRKEAVEEEFVKDPVRLIENIDKLKAMTPIEWGNYAFSRDPIHRKVDEDKKAEMIMQAYQSGIDLAAQVREKFGRIDVKKIAKKLSLDVKKEESGGSENYIVFAKYNYPNAITIYMNNVEAFNTFIKEEKLTSRLENVVIEDVLLAHEMYHYFEENQDDMYAKNTKIVLWKLGKFEYKSGLIALGEIAAMSFAKELLGLSYNPYIFDSLMLFPHDYKKAESLMNDIFTYREDEE